MFINNTEKIVLKIVEHNPSILHGEELVKLTFWVQRILLFSIT